MTRTSGLAALITLGIALTAAPAAHADGVVSCQFSVAKPFVYSVNGADYMGSRVDVSDCRTDLPAAPLTLQMHLTASGAPLELAGPSHTLTYSETREVHNGDSFSVSFPNDDRLMPLYPGVYGAKASVRTDLPGEPSADDPAFADYQCSTWDFPGMTCTPATHI
ncbi:hypothetical protein ABW16_04180 [Mycolicibacter heraklionensis]|uniref:Uncharacterized protein n=1 Tax=Mycolicibacter heraklionensis TaxID=512402 RepID=A0ABR5FJ30_9MYCO|nr:hypothetical protein [Mycolicibacter heraklionensis]KLO30910.1 hypothetical protein ABW16_04180 [Mycolicibacter heraklionensis]